MPARFDDTEVPEILPAVKYIPLADMSPAKFGKVILEKLRVQLTEVLPGQYEKRIEL